MLAFAEDKQAVGLRTVMRHYKQFKPKKALENIYKILIDCGVFYDKQSSGSI